MYDTILKTNVICRNGGFMKKGLKITLIVLVVMVGVVLLDTLQAKIFDNSPLLKIRENLDGGSTDYIDKGLLVNYYHCNNSEKATTWKGTKFACSVKEKSNERSNEDKYSRKIDNTTIELSVFTGWHYEEITFEDSKFALKLYKDSQDKYATLNFYKNLFGVCGTGRTTEEITLNNGITATIGYYGEPIWSDISFYDFTNIAFINHGLEEENTEEFFEIVKTLNIKDN